MPRKGITAYDLLISCPGDVTKYINVVKDCIDNFNRLLGTINNAEIVGKHWSTDSFSQSGDRPQELLNDQFVRECDAAVAIFWTRFGTPTDKYGSGTEEEIEEMLSSGKQVFMYFVDEPINPEILNSEQYKKVQEFRDRYKNRGIYFIVSSEKQFEKQFTNDITRYFLSLIIGEDEIVSLADKKSMLDIIDYKTGTKRVSVISSSFGKSSFIQKQERSIVDLFDELSSIHLLSRTDIEKETEEADYQKLVGINYSLSRTLDVEIENGQKEVIVKYANEKGISLPEDFWNLGNLTRTQALVNPIIGGDTPTYNGTEEEKRRYNLVNDLYWKVKELNDYYEYFSAIDNYKFIQLVLTNTGTDIEEDIDVKLRFEKGILVRSDDMPVPGITIIDTLLDMRFIETLLRAKETDSVFSYSDYPDRIRPFSYHIDDPFYRPSAEQEYENSKEEYNETINRLNCFEIYEKESEDVLMIHFRYLKHHTSMAFPSALAFSRVPEKIEYEIVAKHTAEILKGTLDIITK